MKKFPATCLNNLFDDTVEWTMFWQQGWGNYRPSPPSWCLALPSVCWGTSQGSGQAGKGWSMKKRWMELCPLCHPSFSCHFGNKGVQQCRTFWIMRHNLFVVGTDCQKNCCHSTEKQSLSEGKNKGCFPNMTKLEPTHVGLKVPAPRSWKLENEYWF